MTFANRGSVVPGGLFDDFYAFVESWDYDFVGLVQSPDSGIHREYAPELEKLGFRDFSDLPEKSSKNMRSIQFQ